MTQRVRATKNWNSPIQIIPGQRALRYPSAPPHIATVPDSTARYLIQRGMAIAIDGSGNDISFPELNQEPDNQEPDNQEPDNQEPDNQEPDNQEPDNQEPDNQEPDNQEPDNQESEVIDLALEFLIESEVQEITKVKTIGNDTANKLKAESDLNWETVQQILSDRQTKALIAHINN